MKKTLSLLLSLLLCVALCVPALAADYSATAKGFGGDVTVTLSIEFGAIVGATAEGAAETAGIGTNAIEKLPVQMVELNSVELDAVSGATVTSNAILTAAVDALAQAGLKPGDLASKNAVVEEVEADKPTFENPDVIIVGAGSSGMNAAIAASEAGAKVYLIEQNDATGGSIRYAGGTSSAAGAQMQIDAGLEDSPENFAADIERMGGGTNIPELTKKHTENAAAAIDWMDQVLGLDFGDRQPKMSGSYDAFNVEREYRVTGGGIAIANAVRAELDKHIEAGTVSLLLNTRVVDIIMEDTAVVGVVLEDGTEYFADAIILATGGYGHNEDLINRYNFANVLSQSPAFVTGDGYVFAEKAGAVFSNMDYLPAYPGGMPVDGFTLTTSAYVTDYNNTIWVDLNGERLVAEMGALDSERKAAYANAEENLVYIVFDQSVRENQTSIVKKDEGWAKFDELLAASNCVYSGETIEELAANAGLNAEGLAATIEKMNGFVDAGEDADFGRDMTTMAKIEKGPFYAVKTCPYVMLTKGGPLMNPDAQILNADGEAIPGLYECGELAGGANIGGSANIGGLANTSTIVWGKIAGANAAAYALAK